MFLLINALIYSVMTHYDIIKINEDGKVDFPEDAVYDLGILKGAYFLLEISLEMKEARLEHIALPGKDLIEVDLVVKDEPGVLSTISGIFAKHNVNILFNESEEISTKEAVLVLVLDMSKMDIAVDELRDTLSKREEVLDISVNDVD
ncbi:MAG: ACT domain-containing protein [Thermoplasmata archaeon]